MGALLDRFRPKPILIAGILRARSARPALCSSTGLLLVRAEWLRRWQAVRRSGRGRAASRRITNRRGVR
jgi:hypothetical protein